MSKHFQDFEQDDGLRSQTIAFLDEITCSPNLLPSEHRAASQLLRLLCRDDIESARKNLELLLAPTTVSFKFYYFKDVQKILIQFGFSHRARKALKHCPH